MMAGSIDTLQHLFAFLHCASLPAVLGPIDEKQNNGKVKRRVSLIVPSVSIHNSSTTAVTVLKQCLYAHTYTHTHHLPYSDNISSIKNIYIKLIVN